MRNRVDATEGCYWKDKLCFNVCVCFYANAMHVPSGEASTAAMSVVK